jgi:hypothetical protein
MRRSSYLSIFILSIFSAVQPSVVHSQPASLWDHNESIVGLFADGASRVFRYHEPRIGMQEEGVVSGTLLFSGTKSGTTYSGTAYVFSRRCRGPHPYHVDGTAADDGRAITLYGTAPAGFDAACRPVVYRQDALQFNFLRSTTPPPVVVGSIDRDPAAVKEVEEQEARLAGILAEKEREEQRLRDLRAANHQHEIDLRERQRQREQEELRLAELRIFSSQRDACRNYNVAACETALRSPDAAAQDVIDLQSWRSVAEKFRADVASCGTGSVAACDAALASPALRDTQRSRLNEWRTAASPFNRALQLLSAYVGIVATAATDAVATIRNLPTSTHVAGGLAAVLTLALAAMALRSRRVPSTRPTNANTVMASAAEVAATGGEPAIDQASPSPDRRNRLFAFLNPSPRSPLAAERPPTNEQAPSPLVMARDTPGAIAALELACAYIEEVRQADTPGLEDNETRKHHLNTLSLASKQLDAAAKHDPDACLEGQDDKEVPYRLSINELKAEALLLEGITHQMYDTKRAVPALRKATMLNPNSAHAFYVLGLTHAANMNRSEAVAALQRAVALDPKNLAYRKELNRSENLTVSEIAGYKATRAGEKIFDAGIKTANAGIFVYKLGIYAWNIFAFTWNAITFPFRLVLKIFGVFDRILGLK